VGYTTDMEFHHFLKKPRFLVRKLGKELHSRSRQICGENSKKALSGASIIKFRLLKKACKELHSRSHQICGENSKKALSGASILLYSHLKQNMKILLNIDFGREQHCCPLPKG